MGVVKSKRGLQADGLADGGIRVAAAKVLGAAHEVQFDDGGAVDHQLVIAASHRVFVGGVVAHLGAAHIDFLVAAAHDDLDGGDRAIVVFLVGAGKAQLHGAVRV